ncbi:hypothetical protein EMGBS3_07760 [Anaerolineaceae bacterium]|nr:hypothetical protein EMGBS3_07760 [Anaerolineaceae bacterium]
MVLTAGVALAGAMAVYWAAPRLPAMRAVARQTGRILLALLPVALWWAGAEWFFQHNPVRVYDLGYYGNFWDACSHYLVTGPRPYPQPFLTGPGYWAFLVYTHADLYPAFTFAALPILFGCALATVRLLRGPGARAPFYVYLLLSIGLPLAAQAAKGLDAGALAHGVPVQCVSGCRLVAGMAATARQPAHARPWHADAAGNRLLHLFNARLAGLARHLDAARPLRHAIAAGDGCGLPACTGAPRQRCALGPSAHCWVLPCCSHLCAARCSGACLPTRSRAR